MAKKVFYQLVDDLDGSAIENGGGETLTFSLDGTSYEIDLSAANAAELREGFSRFIKAARVTSRGRKPGARRGAASAGSGRDLGAIRSWAAANGHSVAERGRVPASVLDAYDAANG